MTKIVLRLRDYGQCGDMVKAVSIVVPVGRWAVLKYFLSQRNAVIPDA